MLAKIIIIFGILFIAGGIPAVLDGIEAMGTTVVEIFPFLSPFFEQALIDYVQSPRFISCVIIFAFSSIGVVLTAKEKKWLYLGVSVAVNVITITSVISNLAISS